MEGIHLSFSDWSRTRFAALRSLMTPLRPLWSIDALKQLAILSAFYVAYVVARWMSGGQEVKARQTGDAVMRAERAMHVYIEPWVQSMMSHWDPLLTFFNLYYVYCHLTVMLLCLGWLYVRDPRRFGPYRNWIMTINAMALVFYMLLPTAPPRLTHTSGIVDTLWLLSPVNFEGGFMAETANVYAAIPSLHFSWALFVSMAILMSTSNRWLRAFAIIHPTIMLLTIIVTGNHWLLDAVAAAVVVLAAYMLAVRGGRALEHPDLDVERNRSLQ